MADLSDFEQAAEAVNVERLLASKASFEAKTRQLTSALRRETALRETVEHELGVLRHLGNRQTSPPKWLTRKGTSKHRGTVCSILSDLHFDEVVRPEELNGYNAYNREIAEKRLRRWAERTIILARDYIQGIDYDGAMVALGGDVVTGTIHDELARTNEAEVADTVVHWTERLEAALRMIVDEFGRLHVPCVDGNHDRAYKQIPTKRRARSSVTWIVYNFLARAFQNDKRVTFTIAESPDLRFKVYDHRYLLTHGDSFSGGSGIAGIMSPLMLGQHRKLRKLSEMGDPYDTMLLGHFHQYLTLPSMIANGCLKGYDEYASSRNFPPEPPQQAFWISTPEFGPSLHAPVRVSKRSEEGW